MNMPRHDDLDATARRVHADALAELSPGVQAQLTQRRRAALSGADAPRPAPRTWAWATIAATACVLLVALQLRPPIDVSVDPATDPVAELTVATPDPAAALIEDPDFYLWLASNEPPASALE